MKLTGTLILDFPASKKVRNKCMSWQIDGETMERVTDFIFLGFKITVDGDCSHEIKMHLLLGRKAITNLNSILKSMDITLPAKVRLVRAMVFPVVMYGCESWTIKKVECWRIDAFQLWCWRRLLRVRWTVRSNQSVLKEINPEYTGRTDAEAPKLWPPDAKSWLIGKDFDAGKIEGSSRRGQQRMRWLDGITDYWVWANSRRWWRTGKPGMLRSLGSQRFGHVWVTEQEQVPADEDIGGFSLIAQPPGYQGRVEGVKSEGRREKLHPSRADHR